MDQAILWLVLWFVLGFIGSYLGMFLTVMAGGVSAVFAVENDKSFSCLPVLAAILGTIGWTVLWIYNVVVQIISIVELVNA